MFEQRIQTKSSDQYYFQIVPNYLNVKNSSIVRALKTGNKSFRLKLTKATQVSDESKSLTPGKPINGKIPFEKTQLNFYLQSYSPNRNMDYNVVLVQYDDKSDQQIEIGSFSLQPGDFILQFKQHKTRLINETNDFNKDYSLNFDLFLNDTRYALEKFIRETREKRKQQTRKDVVKKEASGQQAVSRVNRTKSQVNSESSRGQIISGENRFMSPSRRIVRKNVNEKKLIMRNSSPTRSQRSDGGSQTSGKSRDLKFLSGKQGPSSPRRQKKSLAQQEAQKVDKRKQQEEKKRRILDQDARATRQVQKRRQLENKKRQEQKKAEEQKRRQLQNKKKQQQRKAEEQKRMIQNKKRNQQEAKRREDQRLLEQQRRQKQLKLKEEDIKVDNSRSQELKNHRQQKGNQELEKSLQNRKANLNSSKTKKTEQVSGINSSNRSSVKAKPSYQGENILLETKMSAQSSKDEWNKPLKIRRTQSSVSLDPQIVKKKDQQFDIKTTAFYIGFTIISLFLIVNAMMPSSKI